MTFCMPSQITIDISHPDLQANIWTNPAPGSISGISGDVHGYDFISNSGTIPAEPHGTHVAGTIGAVGNNGLGVVGVNWVASLMSLRFIDDLTGSGSTAGAIRAYNYASASFIMPPIESIGDLANTLKRGWDEWRNQRMQIESYQSSGSRHLH